VTAVATSARLTAADLIVTLSAKVAGQGATAAQFEGEYELV
jgi:hypothetical protein